MWIMSCDQYNAQLLPSVQMTL